MIESIRHAGDSANPNLEAGRADSRSRRLALWGALAAHGLMLPWWSVIAILFAQAPLVRFATTSPPADITVLEIIGAFAVLGFVFGTWIWLLARIVVWWRQGRQRLWQYPLMWGLVLTFSVFSLLALLFPSFRRSLTPRPIVEL